MVDTSTSRQRVVAGLLAASGVVLALILLLYGDVLLELADRHVEAYRPRYDATSIGILLWSIAAVLLLSAAAFFVGTRHVGRWFDRAVGGLVDMGGVRAAVRGFFRDPLVPRWVSTSTLVVSLAVLVPIQLWVWSLRDDLPWNESMISRVASASWLLAAVFFGAALVMARRAPAGAGRRERRVPRLFVGTLSFGSLFVWLEEESYGQHLLGFERPEAIPSNYQDEANLHNFFNPAFRYAYPAFGIVFTLVILALWAKPSPRFRNSVVVPSTSLVFLIVGIAAAALMHRPEIMETYLGFFVMLYALRIMVFARRSRSVEEAATASTTARNGLPQRRVRDRIAGRTSTR